MESDSSEGNASNHDDGMSPLFSPLPEKVPKL